MPPRRVAPWALRAAPALAALAALAAAAPLPPGAPIDVRFAGGGVATGVAAAAQGVSYWLGVPFAASTEGANAFRAPQPRAPWAGKLNATAFAPGCLQPHHNADVPPQQSFDCLSLNIFMPGVAPPPAAGAGGTPFAVMVFFNGGAFLEGSDEGPFGMYSGASLAAHFGVVVVAANYRLGAYGWLGGLPELGITGNFGIADQIAALAWVRDNVAAVGGDASRVTVFGESAGAMSIGILMTSPRAAGLFSRAIMESNVGGFNYPNATHAAVYAATFCADKALNCTTGPGGACSADCLRAASPDAVMSAWNTATGDVGDFVLENLGHILDGLLGTGPVIDGDFVVAEPLGAVESGSYWARSLPVLLGTNTNEGETFIYDGVDFPLPGFLVPLAYAGILGLNETAAALVDAQPRYNTSAFADGRTPLSQMVTDMWFRCASERFLFGAAAAGATELHAYRFDHLYSNASIFPQFGLPDICAHVVCHASELPFVFHELPSFSAFTPEEDSLALTMGRLWTSFAKGEDISADWPRWTPAARQTLVLNETRQVESTLGLCGFWDSLRDAYFW